MKILILLSLLLLAVSVSAQTSPQLDSISAAVRTQVGAASTYAVQQAVNRAYQQVCRDYPAYGQIDTLEIDSITGSVAVPSDFDRVNTLDMLLTGGARQPLWSLEGQPQDTIAKWITKEMDVTDSTDQKRYQTFAGYLYTYPRWSRDDTASFEIRYFAIGAALVDSTDSILVSLGYRNAVFFYACAEVQTQRGRFADAMKYRELCWAVYGPPITKPRINQ